MGYNKYDYARKVGTSIILRNPQYNVPRIEMVDNGYLKLYANTDILFYEQLTTQIAKLAYTANVTTLTGGVITGDDLYLKANNADTLPVLQLHGNGKANLNATSGSDVELTTGGAGRVRFGTHTATGDAVSDGSIEIKDAGGTTRKLMTKA